MPGRRAHAPIRPLAPLLAALFGLLVMGVPTAEGVAPPVPTFAAQLGVAGAGHAAIYPSGLDVSSQTGIIYVADTGNDQVAAFASQTVGWTQLWRQGHRGNRQAGNFDNPRDVAYLNGQVFVDDTGNNRVQVLNASDGGQAETPWPLGTSSLGISAGKDANHQDIILVSEDVLNRVAVYGTDGSFKCFITGPDGTLHAPRDAATNAAGDVYVADYSKDRIVEFGPVNAATSTCSQTVIGGWGSSGQGQLQFKRPYGVDIDGAGNVFVADSDNDRIQEFTAAGAYLHTYGDKLPPNGSGTLFQLRRVAVASGKIYAADLWGWHVDQFGYCPTAACIAPVRRYPDPPAPPATGSFNEPSGLTFDGAGKLDVADAVNQRIQPFTPGADGASWTAAQPWGTRGWGKSDLSGFNWPRDVTYAGSGNLWVADTKNSRLLEFGLDGTPVQNSAINLKTLGMAMPWPYGIDAIPGQLIVADTFGAQIESRPTQAGSPQWAVPSANGIAFKNPYAVTDSNGALYVADTGNKRIVTLNPQDGSYAGTTIGTGVLHSPQGVAVDPLTKTVWVADTSYNQLIEFDPVTGQRLQTLKTFGNGDTFNHPTHLAIRADSAGTPYLYVCDVFNDRVVIFNLHEVGG